MTQRDADRAGDGGSPPQTTTPDTIGKEAPMTLTTRNIALAIALAVLAATLAACGGYDPTPTPYPRPTPTPRIIYQEPSAPTPTSVPQQPDQGVIGGSANPNAAPYDLTFFEHSGVNPFVDTEDDRLSTFAIDVDTASYTVARHFVRDGNLPDPASVRVEEFVNFFDHDYEPPARDPFAIHVEGSPSPFGGENHWLMRVGLQAREIGEWQRKDATLIFAIDVSGSMGREDRLGLVKRSLALLVDELGPRDAVGIVVYGSSGRVLLLSDGVGNVGRTSAEGILERIRSDVDRGVTLTTVGFGMGNYNDVLMEQLANDGDGAYHYVDNLSEARRVFVDNLASTIQTVAKDAKVQVEFNPNVVSRYRLLGYENRAVADEDFRDDTVDAGEIGANHSVTALYELKFHEGTAGDIGTVSLRYEDPDTGGITEIRRSLQVRELAPWFESASPTFQLAAVVAEYAEILRNSYWAQDGDLRRTADEAARVQRLLPYDPNVAEFADLVARAARIEQGR